MYHAKDGLFFEVLPFGDIRVVATLNNHPPFVGDHNKTNILFETVLQRSMIASIMAFSCKRGYTSNTFYEAYGFLQHPELAEKAPEMPVMEPTNGDASR